jgi:hypothetical protein
MKRFNCDAGCNQINCNSRIIGFGVGAFSACLLDFFTLKVICWISSVRRFKSLKSTGYSRNYFSFASITGIFNSRGRYNTHYFFLSQAVEYINSYFVDCSFGCFIIVFLLVVLEQQLAARFFFSF